MMGNGSEAEVWAVDIQLMYAQQWPSEASGLTPHEQSIQAQQQLLQQQILMSRGGGGGGGGGAVGGVVGGASSQLRAEVDASSSPSGGGDSLKRVEKTLRELLEEQDAGEIIDDTPNTKGLNMHNRVSHVYYTALYSHVTAV